MTARFDTPNKFLRLPEGSVRLPRFAIIDEHEYVDERTKKLVVLSRERLEKLAEHLNKRAEITNDPVPLVLGHTRPKADEKDQPEIVGYAAEFQVEPFGKTGKVAIYATPFALPGEVDTFRKHPRRSIELWTEGGDDIDPIAIMGATTPRRDLGLHIFQRATREGTPYRYEMTETETKTPKPENDKMADSMDDKPKGGCDEDTLKQLVAACGQSDWAKSLAEGQQQIMAALQELQENAMGGGGHGDDDLDLDSLLAAHDDQGGGDDDEPDRKGKPEPMAAGGGMGSPMGGNNGYSPEYSEHMQRLQGEHAELAMKFSRQEHELYESRRRNAEAFKRLEELENVNLTKTLEIEINEKLAGKKFNRERIFNRLFAMTAPEREVEFKELVNELPDSEGDLPNGGKFAIGRGLASVDQLQRQGSPTKFEQASSEERSSCIEEAAERVHLKGEKNCTAEKVYEERQSGKRAGVTQVR